MAYRIPCTIRIDRALQPQPHRKSCGHPRRIWWTKQC
jgi:hypothetical protein